MSIAVMKEGDKMGRGIPPDPRVEAEIRRRRLVAHPDQVIIFGAGPSGMMAAHAVKLSGREPVLLSMPDEPGGGPIKSKIGGATYLHSPIPDVNKTEPDAMVRFRKLGTAEGYALKVYGDARHPTSWDKFEGEHPAWELQPIYDELWRRYAENIIPMKVMSDTVKEFLQSHSVVISTIPPHSYCKNPAHRFPHRNIWVTEFAPECDRDNEIVYNGIIGTAGARYRSSRLFGRTSSEYAEKVPGAQMAPGFKVLPTNCDCFPDLMRVGRFGKWQPGVLVDHAFQETWTAMWDNFEGA